MEHPEDSWESVGWNQEDLNREEVLQLARRLAAQRERQRTNDLVQIEDLKRALRERAADVARRELEVERRTRELEDHEEAPRRTLRFRRTEKPAVDEDHAYADELQARRESELEERARTVEARERELAERERRVAAAERELEDHEEAPRRTLRFRRTEKPAVDEDHAYADELQARRESELEERARTVEARERELAERETALLARQLELEESEPALAERERRVADVEVREEAVEAREASVKDVEARAEAVAAAEHELAAARETVARQQRDLDERTRALAAREEELDALARQTAATEEESGEHERRVAEREAQLAAREQELRGREAELLRLQAGLAAQQESIRRRERSIEDAERALARETVVPATAHVSFSEGLESLTGWRPRRD